MKLYALPVGMLQTNCYILVNEELKEAVVVDPGGDAGRIISHLEALKLERVAAIFITHGHSDHISALNEVRRATGAPVYISREDAPALQDANRNLSFFVGAAIECAAPEYFFTDGEDVQAAGFTFKIFATPGHTKGGICIYDEEDGFVFAGDTIFCESIGRTDLPGGSYKEILASIKSKLLTLPEDTVLLPGHGPKTTVGWERRRNPFLQ